MRSREELVQLHRDLRVHAYDAVAPKIAGGEAPRILEGALPEVEELELVWLLDNDGELFGRYRRRGHFD